MPMTEEHHDEAVEQLKALLKHKREQGETYHLLAIQSRDGMTVAKELSHDIALRKAVLASVQADDMYQQALDVFIAASEAP